MIPHKTISNNFENGQKQASKYSRSRPLRVFRLTPWRHAHAPVPVRSAHFLVPRALAAVPRLVKSSVKQQFKTYELYWQN